MTPGHTEVRESAFSVLCITQGQWGKRIASNIGSRAPHDWTVHTWRAPRILPPIIDDPEEFISTDLPEAQLILSLGENAGLAQLIPDIARSVGAKAVVAPIDNNQALPAGLARQLGTWLDEMGIKSVFPKPFCSLTTTTYNRTPLVTRYEDETIAKFARHFGQPKFDVSVQEGKIKGITVLRDAACGCAHAVAESLVGASVDGSLEQAGLLHHHYPCWASMEKDPDYRDTLMHVSGNILKDDLKDQIRSHLNVSYLRPEGHVEQDPD